MMFAVPFQGYAAAAMVFCGPGHTGATAEITAELSEMRVDTRHGQGNHHHESAHAAKPPAKDSTAKTASAEPDAMHKCGTCVMPFSGSSDARRS
jgi:hypothetical protein